jgi:S1-C subfamily serine protease
MSEPSPPRSGLWPRLRARMAPALPFASGVAAALVALLLFNALFPAPTPLTAKDVGEVVAQTMASATPAPANSALVYQIIQPSLVLIEARSAGGDDERGYGIGSGVIVTADGDILTSLHVVADAAEVRVTFADGTRSPALVTVEQPENDIAVLRPLIPPDQIFPAVLGNPGAVRVGDEAYVVGNPLGLYGSMSAGVISGLNRSFRPPDGEYTLDGLIQIDAAVNPGNSGGPLLNRNGQVIGIVAGLVNPTDEEVFIGLGFAVPISVAGEAAGMPPY